MPDLDEIAVQGKKYPNPKWMEILVRDKWLESKEPNGEEEK